MLGLLLLSAGVLSSEACAVFYDTTGASWGSCDSLWTDLHLNCASLTTSGWDCSGCNCLGDSLPPSSPPQLSPPSSPPQLPPPSCPNTCLGAGPEYANDGQCDDGGPGSAYGICAFGTDCNDCKQVPGREHPGCTGPHADLIVNSDLIKDSLYIKNVDAASRDSCLVEEGCLNGPGMRKVIAFTTQVHNIGCAPFVIGVPSGYEPGEFDTIGNACPPFTAPSQCPNATGGRRLSSEDGFSDQRKQLNLSRGGRGTTTGRYPSHRRLDNGWSWHDCHQHWHYDNYAHYALRKLCTNEDVAWEDRPVVGHKNGWCVSDTDTYGLDGSGGRCVAQGGPYPPLGLHDFSCTNMGISSGCSDMYFKSLDCQWIDITDSPNGYYWLTVATNWNETARAQTSPENDYTNNEANVPIEIYNNAVHVLTDAKACGSMLNLVAPHNSGLATWGWLATGSWLR